MKKVIISMAIAALCLCSCGNNNQNKQAEGEAAAVEQAEECCGKCKEEGMHRESKETQRSRQGMARPDRSASPFRRRQKKISAGNRARQKKRYAAKN
jgi:hypothetical protein